MSQLIYSLVDTSTPMSELDGSEYRFPTFTAGEVRQYGLRFVRIIDGQNVLYDPDVRYLKAEIGLVDARPTGGATAYQIGHGPSTAANTTAVLPVNHTGTALKGAINALAAVVATYGLCEVEEVDGGWVVVFANAAAAVPISFRKNRLFPLTTLNVLTYQIDGEWRHELRHQLAQLDETSAWVRVPPPKPKIVAYRDGAFDNSGRNPVTEIQKLELPPDYRGSYDIRRNDSMARTPRLDENGGEEEIQEAVQAIYQDEGTINVDNAGDDYALIEFAGDLAGQNIDLLEVVVGDTPPGDPTITISFDRPAVFIALRSVPQVKVFFTLTAWIAKTGAEESDPGEPTVLFRREITIQRRQSSQAMATAADPKWLRPPNPSNNIPYNDDQVTIGNASWEGAVGDGINNLIEIPHGLATEAIASLMVRENISDGRVLTQGTDYEVRITNPNLIKIDCTDIPDVNSLYVTLMMVSQVSMVDPHTHTKSQVDGLEDDLEELFGRVYELEQVLPSTGPGASSSQASGIVKKLPKIQEILFLERPYPAGIFGEDGIDETKLPDDLPPLMLPACHNAVVLSALTVPDFEGNAGKVWVNNTGETLSLGQGSRGGKVPVGGHFASDGRTLYAVTRSGETNSYYPKGFERTLWQIFTNEKELRAGRLLDGQLGLLVQILKATSAAQWVFVIEKGTAPQDVAPSPVGINLQNVVWNTAAPIVSQRILLGPNAESHSAGVRVKRTSGGMSLDSMLYGVWEGDNAAAPADANFGLRGRFVNFDTENALAADARGWVTCQVTGALGGEDSESNEPKFVII